MVLGEAGAEEVARLIREARAAAAFSHPNAVVVHDVGEIDGVAFVAMELLAGRSLRSFIGDDAVPMSRRIGWLVEIARALGAAHRAGLVHRDVKPENVIVRDEDQAAKVVDFGIARTFRSPVPGGDDPTGDVGLGTITRGDVVIGTPLYMAPEQLRAEAVDGRADQFAWGVMAYQLLTGRHPWPATSMMQLAASVASKVPQPMRGEGGVAPPPHVEHAVLRALSADRDGRFDSMEDAAAALSSVDAGSVDAAVALADTAMAPTPPRTAPQSAPPPAPGPRRSRWLAPAAGIAAVAVIVAVISSGGSQVVETATSPSAATSASALPGTFGMLDAPMPSTTPQALAEYRASLGLMREGSWVEAVPHLERSIELDPDLGAAHIRRALMQLAVPGSDAARHSFREARRRAERMLPRDRAILDALGPAFADPPAAADAAQRMIASSDAAPGDAELASLAAAMAFHRGRYADTVRLTDRALAIDPRYADAWQLAALGHGALGAWDRADAALASCLEVAPSSLDCRVERGTLLASRGRCAEAEVVARDALSVQPGLRNAASLLANARYFAGDEDAFILNVVRSGVTGLPPAAIRFQHARLEAGLAVLRGRFADAAEIAGKAAPAELRERDVRDTLALTVAWALLEAGEPARAASAARDYMASTGAMIPPSLDVSPMLRSLAGSSDQGPPPPFATSSLPSITWALWAWPQATDSTVAARLLDARPELPPRNMLIRSVALHAFEARILQLAGRRAEAATILETAARACHVLEEPFATTWANLWLGELRESEGDTAAACDAYRVVVDRWGAVAGSPSAQAATKARLRLKCTNDL